MFLPGCRGKWLMSKRPDNGHSNRVLSFMWSHDLFEEDSLFRPKHRTPHIPRRHHRWQLPPRCWRIGLRGRRGDSIPVDRCEAFSVRLTKISNCAPERTPTWKPTLIRQRTWWSNDKRHWSPLEQVDKKNQTQTSQTVTPGSWLEHMTKKMEQTYEIREAVKGHPDNTRRISSEKAKSCSTINGAIKKGGRRGSGHGSWRSCKSVTKFLTRDIQTDRMHIQVNRDDYMDLGHQLQGNTSYHERSVHESSDGWNQVRFLVRTPYRWRSLSTAIHDTASTDLFKIPM